VKILIRATNWIGDAVLSLPALRAVRLRYPAAEIAVLARPWVAALYENESSIDRVIPLRGAPGVRSFAEKWNTVKALRRERFDLAIVLPNSFESAALPFLAGVGRRVGYRRDGRSPLLTDAIRLPRKGEIPRHERYYYPEMLRRAGIIESLPVIDEILFDAIPEARVRGTKLLESKGIAGSPVGVSPGAAFGGAKRWPADRFAEAAARIAAKTGSRVAVFGSAAETVLCAEVAAATGGVNLAGATTLREFIDMAAACRLFLANDSGAMHVAAALGVPSVTVFGPTDETGTGPVGGTAAIVREAVPCAPCKLRECPLEHQCMTGVPAERVVTAAFQVLGPTAASPQLPGVRLRG